MNQDKNTHSPLVSVLTASVHRIRPPQRPLFPPSSPMFHFLDPNCSVGSSSFTVIAFHPFHLLSERLDIYLRAVLAPLTCSPRRPAPAAFARGGPSRRDKTAPAAETQPPIYLGINHPPAPPTPPRRSLAHLSAPFLSNSFLYLLLRERAIGELERTAVTAATSPSSEGLPSPRRVEFVLSWLSVASSLKESCISFVFHPANPMRQTYTGGPGLIVQKRRGARVSEWFDYSSRQPGSRRRLNSVIANKTLWCLYVLHD